MNSLERALVAKAGHENGWENVVESGEAAVVLASARHQAQVRIMPQFSGIGWRMELPAGLIHQELTRTFPGALDERGAFVAEDTDRISRLLRRAAELAQSLPKQAARTYAERVHEALERVESNGTEVERLVRQRVGQNTFREALIDYWGGACSVTGLTLPAVLRASHAKPWVSCDSDEERLDVFNGFLLCANLDALFDRGLITFDDGGHLVCSPQLIKEHRDGLQLTETLRLRWLAFGHRSYLNWHRENVFLD